MAEIDPVILELRAEMGRYKAELKSSTALAESSFRRQDQAIRSLERQIKSSSANIGTTLKGLAGGIGAALSVRQVASIIDSYTRFKNQLRTAGIEGQALAKTQERLLEIAQRYGVELEAIGTLYGRSASAAKELGLNQADQARITETTAAALQISGASAAQASGALLQLSQVLGGTKVQAEEFNSLIDGLRPLLQGVAAGSDKWRGSVAKLTQDVKAGKVSTQEFVDALLKGSQGVIDQAAASTLTLSGAFTKLTNSMMVYIGEAAEANGITGAVAGGMELLANNLDTVADALAVIAAVMLGRFAAGMLAGAASTGVASAAIFAMQARAIGAATTMEALGFASAAAGRTMLAAFGGPVGLAIAALTLGIGYLATRTKEAEQASGEYAQQQEQLRKIQGKTADATDQLATATGRAREQALANAKALRQETAEYIRSAHAALIAARAKAQASLATLEAERSAASAAPAPNIGMAGGFGSPTVAVAAQAHDQAMTNWRVALKNLEGANAEFERLTKIINAPAPGRTGAAASDKKTKKDSGPTAEEIEARFQSDLRRARAEQIQDELQIATDTDRRAELQNELLNLEYEERLAQIRNEKDYTAAQKAALIDELNKRFGREGAQGDDIRVGRPSAAQQAIDREEEDRRRAQAEAALRIEAEALEAEAALVDSRRERLEVERRILKLQQQEEQSRLEAAIAAGEIADATQARADLERKQAADREGLERTGESPLDRYARDLRKTPDQISDEVEALVVDELQAVQDGITNALADAIGTDDPLIKGLIDLFIEQVIMRPLAQAFSDLSSSAGPGGLFGSILGTIFNMPFGRASGGYVGPGQTVRVNEHKGTDVELLRMGPQGGKVIPLGQTRAMSRSGAAPVISAPQYHLHSPVVTADLIREMERISARNAAVAGRASYQQSMRDAPGAVANARRYGG